VAEEAPVSFRVMDLVEVAVPLPAQHAVVLLAEAEPPHRTFSFPIGLADGAALAAAVERGAGVRPSTHELASRLLVELGADVIAVRLVDERHGVVHAELDLMAKSGRLVLDCRPSDGLVLALRQAVRAPILLDERLLGGSSAG
jgi:bifunctional DNase/RNase